MPTTPTTPADPGIAEALPRVAERFGPVTAREFESMSPIYLDETLAWLDRLAGLTDREFVFEAEAAIAASSVVASFKGNYQHLHLRASAAFTEGSRRAKAAGVSPSCGRHHLYDRAWRRFAASQGYNYPTPECTCTSVPSAGEGA